MLYIGTIQVLIMLIALVRAKALSLFLGPDGFGIVSTVDQTLLSVVQLGGLSLPLVGMKFMARGHSESHADFQRTFGTFSRAIASLAMLAAAASVLVFVMFPTLLGGDIGQLAGYLLIGVAAVPPMMLHIHFVNTLAAAQRSTASAALNMLVLLTLAAAAVLGMLAAGITGLFAATATASIVSSVVTALYVRSRLGLRILDAAHGVRAELRRYPEIVRYSLYLYLALASYSTLMLFMRYAIFDRLGAAATGLLHALLAIALTLAAVPNAMSALHLAPLLNRNANDADKLVAANHFAERILLFLTIGGTVAALFPRLLLTLLFSAEFSPAAGALVAFLLWQCLYQVANAYGQLLIGLDEVALYAAFTAAGYVSAGLLVPAFAGKFGIVGAGVALCAGMTLNLAGTVTRLHRRFGRSVNLTVALRTLLFIVAALAAGMVFDPSTELQPGGLLGRAIYVVATGALLWMTRTGEEVLFLTRRLKAAPNA